MLKGNKLAWGNPRYEKAKKEGKIDELCIPFCDLLNRIGLKTDYCCQGHPFDPDRPESNEIFYIAFDNNLPDAEIFAFLALLEEAGEGAAAPWLRYPNGFFYKRHRMDKGVLWSTWIYMINAADDRIKESMIRTERERFQLAERLYLEKREKAKEDRFSPWE